MVMNARGLLEDVLHLQRKFLFEVYLVEDPMKLKLIEFGEHMRNEDKEMVEFLYPQLAYPLKVLSYQYL